MTVRERRPPEPFGGQPRNWWVAPADNQGATHHLRGSPLKWGRPCRDASVSGARHAGIRRAGDRACRGSGVPGIRRTEDPAYRGSGSCRPGVREASRRSRLPQTPSPQPHSTAQPLTWLRSDARAGVPNAPRSDGRRRKSVVDGAPRIGCWGAGVPGCRGAGEPRRAGGPRCRRASRGLRLARPDSWQPRSTTQRSSHPTPWDAR